MKNKDIIKFELLFLIPVVLLLFSKICYSGECTVPSVSYPKIQSAINDSNCNPITVLAGVYDEQLEISRALILQGLGSQTIIKPSNLTIAKKYARESGGTLNTAPIIAILGSDVTIRQLKISGINVDDLSGLEGVDLFTGIFYRGITSGNVTGVINNVELENINILDGTAIYLSSYGSSSLSIEVKNSKISSFLSKGIFSNGNELSVNIHNNTIYGRGYVDDYQQNGIEINGAKGTISNNYITNFSYADFDGRAVCIFVLNAQGPLNGIADVIVSNNTLVDCQSGISSWADSSNEYDIEIKSNVINNGNLRTLKIKNVIGIHVATWSQNAKINATIGGGTELEGNDLTGGGPGKAIQIGDILYNHPDGTVGALIKHNIISGFWPVWDWGIWLGIGSSNITIDSNVLINNYNVDSQQYGAGINILQGVNVQNIVVNNNVIAGNRPYGVYNAGSGILNAKSNWWNSSDGPRPTGRGDLVSTNVDYEPYLTEKPLRLQKPDLTLVISVPTSASTNINIKLTDKTVNLGSGNSLASKTYFYISSDPILDAGDIKIGERDVPGLTPGSKSKGTITSDTITLNPGIYYIIAKADGENTNDEYNEYNNIAIRQIKIGLPDLVVYKLDAPRSVAPGSTVEIKYIVKNRGMIRTPISKIRFYLSKDILLDNNDEFLIEKEVPILIRNQSTGVISFRQEIPQGAWYYLLAKVDAEEKIEEMNENNNLGYRVMAVGPDLVVSSIIAPSYAYAGSTISVKETTKNNSTSSSTNAASKTKFYLSTDTALDNDDYEFENYHSVPVLGPNGSDTKIISLKIPLVNAGTYYIIAKADADNEITEYNENNNTRCKSISIK